MPRPTSVGRGMPLRLLAASAALLLVAGCGSSTDVSGKVTYKGAPLPGGNITLVASNGQVYTGSISADGTFAIPGVPTGNAQVAVVGANPAAGTKPPPASRGAGGGGGRGGAASAGRGAREENPAPPPELVPPAPKGPVLPAQYADPRTSGLTTSIKAGQPVTIDLP